MKKPKILFFDIETRPILAYVWGLFDQNIGLNQIKEDWGFLSFAAKWQGSSKMHYADLRGKKNVYDEKPVIDALWKLLDEADIVITQNGKKFDAKKANAKFVEYGLKPPSPYRHIDTLQIGRKNFGFTSHKLEYMTGLLVPECKKSSHKKFPGFDLWIECMRGNKEAWNEMEKYNKRDVVATEKLYDVIAPYDTSLDINVYLNGLTAMCKCGSQNVQYRGAMTTATGKFRRFQCQDCGTWSKGKENLLSKEKRASLRPGVR